MGQQTQRLWTPSEDAIVLKHTPSRAVQLLNGRTRAAVSQRRFNLMHPDLPWALRPWTTKELAMLRRVYSTSKTSEIMHLFPGRGRREIVHRASKLKLKKLYVGNDTAALDGHRELLDQIVVRARSDGIAIGKLDKILDCGSYFSKAHYRDRAHPLRLKVVARAVEFFGGKLVIDWCDR